MKSKQPPKKAKQPPRSAARAARSTPRIASPTAAASVMSTGPVTPSTPPPTRAAAPRRAAGPLHRSTLTPADLRGRDLVRFLRIHAKRSYGKRGEHAIYLLAREVASAATMSRSTC